MRDAPATSLLRAFLFALALFISRSQPCFAQQPQSSSGQLPLEAKTELVKLDVTVLNNQGDFVSGLDQTNFRVLDNGIEQPIGFFAPVTTPAKVVVILETSPAVYLFQDEHLIAAYSLFQGLADEDEVALVSYSDVPKSVVPFTTDKYRLLDALGNIQYMMGMASLNLYDTVSDVIDGVASIPGKKALVLLTTGFDTSSPDRWDLLTQKLRGTDAVIFAVGLGGSLENGANGNVKKSKFKRKDSAGADADSAASPENASLLERARTALVALSNMTGGRAYFPGAGDDFASAYREIAAAVRHEYVLGIAPQHDGRPHKLSVEIVNTNGSTPKKQRGQPEYRVLTREAYFAPGR